MTGRRSAASLPADARAQIFFQTGEGMFKGVVVLPVREIWDVIFADFFRQLVAPKSDEGGSFAGGRVQALPFFQRRGIRQRDGKKFAPLFTICKDREICRRRNESCGRVRQQSTLPFPMQFLVHIFGRCRG